ncbi:MAG TPA: amidase, partial [Verrucomicrobiae bacterium]|nr:amidase [Verrucomicrobiae bacterium]
TLFPGVLWSMADAKGKVTKEMVETAAEVADVPLPEEYVQAMLDGLNENKKHYEEIYGLHIPNSVPPAYIFDPVLGDMKFDTVKRPMKLASAPALNITGAPKNIEDVAFYSARQLGELVRTRKVSSVALTEMYLARLKKYDPLLKFVITLTEDRARAQAKEADRDLAAGRYRGPLHGLPWGAKDLLAVKGYRTTWGAGGFEQQTIDEDATVVKRLDKAGAVLVAKLTLGALAMGDKWFGGMTRNPWNIEQGSSGSSAGPASATAAGLVPFAIGSETHGSIVSPCERCGVTGLRPTYGRVSRTGAMSLSASMDKLGPIARTVEDCAIVFNAIYGPDGVDQTLYDAPFNYDSKAKWQKLRIGYLAKDFEKEEGSSRTNSFAALDKLRSMGAKLVPVELPKLPAGAISFVLDVEAAAAFDDLTRSHRDDLMKQQNRGSWPNIFRKARFIPAVEYVQANRVRYLLVQETARALKDVDVLVSPTFAGECHLITNLTGQPCVVVPDGFKPDGTPTAICFLGNLFHEAEALEVAKAYQDATGLQLQHPKLDKAPF